MKYKMLIIIIFSIFIFNPIILAEEIKVKSIELEDIVITPLKIKQSIDEVSTSITVLNGRKLGEEGIITLKEAIDRVPGVDISTRDRKSVV